MSSITARPVGLFAAEKDAVSFKAPVKARCMFSKPSFGNRRVLSIRTVNRQMKLSSNTTSELSETSEAPATEATEVIADTPVEEVPVASEEEGGFLSFLPFVGGSSAPKGDKVAAPRLTAEEKRAKKEAMVAYTKQAQIEKAAANYRSPEQIKEELAAAKAAKAAAKEAGIAKALATNANPVEFSIQDKSSGSFQVLSTLFALLVAYGLLVKLYGPTVVHF